MKIIIHENRKIMGLTALLRNILEYLLVICLILNGNSVWMNIKSSRDWLGKVLQILVIFLMLALLLTYRFKKSCIKNACLILGGIIGYLLILEIVNLRNTKGLVGFAVMCAAIMAFSYLYQSVGGLECIIYKYEDIVIMIAVVSVFFWILGSVLRIIPISGHVLYDWTANGLDRQINKYWGIYYETQWTYLPGYGDLIRNTAIFTEAPMCSLHFSVALLIEVFLKEKLNFRRCVFLIFAVLTTFSTTGYLIVVITIFSTIAYSKRKNHLLQYLKVLIIPISLIIGLVASIILIQLKLDSGSGMVRLDDFVAGYKTWIGNPLFGCGFGNYDAIKNNMSVWRRSNIGFSNSIMQVLAYGGIYFGILYITPFVSGIYKTIRLKQYRKSVFIGCIFFLFVFTIIPYKFFTIMLLAYFMFLNK